MVDSKYSIGAYKSVETSIGAVKLKKCVNMQLKNYLLSNDMFLIDIRFNQCVLKLFNKMLEL